MNGYKINVRNEEYQVEQVELSNEIQYTISTDCNYIMTVKRNDEGNWSAKNDVQVLDETLISEIGAAIEFREA